MRDKEWNHNSDAGTAKKMAEEFCISRSVVLTTHKDISLQQSINWKIILINWEITILNLMYNCYVKSTLKLHSKDFIEQLCSDFEELKGIDKVSAVGGLLEDVWCYN